MGCEICTPRIEEIKSLKEEIDNLRSSVIERLHSERNDAGEKIMSAISALRQDLRSVSLGLKVIKEKLRKDEHGEALKEHNPIEFLGRISAGGSRYAILRTEAGDKRVTEGDKVGPWMVEEIKGKEVHLSTASQRRILTVK